MKERDGRQGWKRGICGWALAVALVCAAAPAPAISAQAGGSEKGMPEVDRFVRVGDDGAKLRNLQDASGLVLARLGAGTMLAVHRESYGWLQVEPPGGFPVWVHGRFLQATGEDDVFEVRGNAINMRPGPSSDVANFPLPTKLHSGDRVRRIKRADESVPQSEDWVQVWSPLGATAWVEAAEIRGLPTGKDGKALWREATVELARVTAPAPAPAAPSRSAPDAGAAAKAAEEEAVAQAVRDAAESRRLEAAKALENADALRDHESRSETPDFFAVREAYEKVLELKSDGEIGMRARHGLEVNDLNERAAAALAQVEAERQRRDAEYQRLKTESERAARLAEADAPRYDLAGSLVRRVDEYGVTRFYLNQDGYDTIEIVCSSGRYDLGVFEGREIGVRGESFEQTLQVDDSHAATATNVDVRRVTVLSRR